MSTSSRKIALVKDRGSGTKIYAVAGVSLVSVVALGFLVNYSVSRYRFEQFYIKGQTSLDKGDFEEARNDFKQALGIDQNSAKAYVGLGNSLLEEGKGDIDESINKFDRAIQLDPKLAEAYFRHGVAEQYKQKHEEALSDYNKAIENDSNYAKAYLYRGTVYQYYKSKSTEALEDADKAIALKPEFIEAHSFKCQVLYVREKYSEAIKACSKAIEAKGVDDKDQKKRTLAYYYRANAYLDRDESGDQDAASRDSDQVLQDKSDSSEAYILRGRAYFAQHNYLKALETFTNGINLLKTQNLDSEGSETLAKFYALRGFTYTQTQPPDRDSAADDYWRSIQADQNYAPAYEGMGDLLKSIGNGYYRGCQDKSICKAINFYNSAKDLYSNKNSQEAYQRVLNKIQQL